MAGVLAPEIVESSPDFLIERALVGSPSSEPAVLEQAGAQLRRLHAVSGKAYGFLHEGLGPAAPRLLHGDLHPRHIYAEGNQLTGFIDWGDVAFGDPLFDLGRFSRAGSAATDALLRGYGIERTASLDWTLTFYRTIWSVMAMQWEHAAGGDWYAGHLEAIAADLSVLELS